MRVVRRSAGDTGKDSTGGGGGQSGATEPGACALGSTPALCQEWPRSSRQPAPVPSPAPQRGPRRESPARPQGADPLLLPLRLSLQRCPRCRPAQRPTEKFHGETAPVRVLPHAPLNPQRGAPGRGTRVGPVGTRMFVPARHTPRQSARGQPPADKTRTEGLTAPCPPAGTRGPADPRTVALRTPSRRGLSPPPTKASLPGHPRPQPGCPRGPRGGGQAPPSPAGPDTSPSPALSTETKPRVPEPHARTSRTRLRPRRDRNPDTDTRRQRFRRGGGTQGQGRRTFPGEHRACTTT